MNDREIDPMQMDVQQLSGLKDQFENELNDLGQQVMAATTASPIAINPSLHTQTQP
jgi:hypothetical protein